MYCPYCHAICGSSDHYCHACGFELKQTAGKKGSRWIPLLLLILMSAVGLASFFFTSGSKVTDVNHPWFYLKRGVLYFEADRYTGGSELKIPAKIGGHPVTVIGDNCFAGCENITTVFLPDTITAIGSCAFSNCSALRGIYIPPSVDSIGDKAFLGCSALESVCLHSSITHIGKSAFDLCDRLEYIIFRGSYAQWTQLYDAYINADIGIFCEDGSFFQGENGI